MRWNDQADWIWSTEPTHEALVDPDECVAVQSTWPQANRPPSA